MAESLCCPVCKRQGLAQDCQCCPQCEADLACFQDLDRLRTERTESTESAASGEGEHGQARSSNHLTMIGVFASVFGAVVVIAVLSFIMGRFDKRLAGIDKTVAMVIHDNGLQQEVSTVRLRIHELEMKQGHFAIRMEKAVKSTANELKHITIQINALEEGLDKRIVVVAAKEINRIRAIPAVITTETKTPPPSNATFSYHIRERDTLWVIARRFYGDGKYYPLILEQNPHLAVRGITPGLTIQIISAPDLAIVADMYNRKTELKNGMLLWHYVVQPKDTRDSIYARFAAPGVSRQIFFDSGVKLVPLDTIKIILQ